MADRTARDIMTPDPVTTTRDVGVTEAAKLMVEHDVGALPVIDDGRLVGLVTEDDLIHQDVKLEYPTYIQLLDGYFMYPPAEARFENELRKAVAATVGDVMTEKVISIQADASVEDVATLLVEKEVSHLPVLEGETLVGIVSKHDVVRSLVEE